MQEAITKYNLSGPLASSCWSAQRVVLVVGQVESDASIRYGAPQLRTNLALLEAVRQRNRRPIWCTNRIRMWWRGSAVPVPARTRR